MTLEADLFFSFRSPYSYLAIGRYRDLARSHDVSITLRPVYPLAIRDPGFFDRLDPRGIAYVGMDAARLAEWLELPFAWPDPDPVIQDMRTGAIALEQPHIHRLTRLGQAAARRGRGLEYAAEAAAGIWGGTRNWHESGVLEEAAGAAGLDWAELEREAGNDALALDAEIAANLVALKEGGHWGVPTLVFAGEPFFGQDRFDLALWRMQQAGLRQR